MSSDNYTKLPDAEHQEILMRIGEDAENFTVFRLNDGVRGKKYMGKFWNSGTRKPTKKMKNTLPEIVAWAKDVWAQFKNGTDSAGRVSMKDMLDKMTARMREEGREEQTIRDLSAPIVAAIAAGLTNLKHPDIAVKVQHFMDNDYRPKCGFGPRTQRTKRQQMKIIGYFRQLGKFATLTQPRRALDRNPFDVLKPNNWKQTTKQDMQVLPFEHCAKLTTDEALARREGLLWAFRLYTTTRASEGNWVRWSHIDFSLKRLFIVGEQDETDIAAAAELDVEGKRVKFDKYRTVRLTDELIDILRPLRPEVGDGYLFSESIRTRAANNECKAMRNHMAACGIPEDVAEAMSPHDFRATSACIWSRLIDEQRLMAHMGHDDNKVTKLYTKKGYDFEVPMEAWADGQWHLRTNPRGRKRYAELVLQEPIPAVGILPAASDIADDLFVILPNFQGLTTIDEKEIDDGTNH